MTLTRKKAISESMKALRWKTLGIHRLKSGKKVWVGVCGVEGLPGPRPIVVLVEPWDCSLPEAFALAKKLRVRGLPVTFCGRTKQHHLS